MSYLLGIDLGATTVTAAVLRPGGAAAVRFGGRDGRLTLPAVLLATPAGDLLCGEPARRRAAAAPDRVARGFLDRVGDPTPLSLGEVAHRPEDLCARLVRVVVDEVSARHGAAPSRIGLTHPGGWGRHKRDRLAGALARHGIAAALVAAPQAVALAHRAGPGPAPAGPLVVADLGGTTSTAAVVWPAEPGALPAVAGPVAGCRDAGADVDDAVFGYVRSAGPAVAAALDALDPDDPQVLAALTALREDCRAAKEVLSRDTETAVPVRLPGLHTSVRLHRSDLDELARPVLEPVVDLVGGVLAGHPDAQVLLAGGTARMPVVVQLLSAALGRPVTVAAEPVHGAARGAALAVAPGAGAAGPGNRVPVRAGAREAGPGTGRTVPAGTADPSVPGTGAPAPGRDAVTRPQPGGDAGTVAVPSPRPAPWTGRVATSRTGAAVALHGSPAAPPPALPAAPPAPLAPRPEPSPPARAPLAPPLPAPDTLVTRDAPRAGVTRRNRLLVGAGGLAGVLAVTGALLFWPGSSASLGELSAAPVLPDASTAPPPPTPAPPAVPTAPVAGTGDPAARDGAADGPTAPERTAAATGTGGSTAPGPTAAVPRTGATGATGAAVPGSRSPRPGPGVPAAAPVPAPVPVPASPPAPAPVPAPAPPPPEGSAEPVVPPAPGGTTAPADPSSSAAAPAPV